LEDEQRAIATMSADMTAWLQRHWAEFMSGQLNPHNDAHWDAFFTTAVGIGVEQIRQVQQAVLDRWNAAN